VREVRLDVYKDPSPGLGRNVTLYSDKTCASAIADVNPPSVGQTVVPFDPGFGIPAGSGLSMRTARSVSAESFVDGYSAQPGSDQPSRRLPTSRSRSNCGRPTRAEGAPRAARRAGYTHRIQRRSRPRQTSTSQVAALPARLALWVDEKPRSATRIKNFLVSSGAEAPRRCGSGQTHLRGTHRSQSSWATLPVARRSRSGERPQQPSALAGNASINATPPTP
jgi:hypothetical protein